MTRPLKYMRMLPAVALAALTVACANMGRPEGGPRDETPPVYTGSNPRMGQLNFTGSKITVDFNENIALDDAMNKIVVSPAQKTPPAISSNGRRVTLELRDTILPSTTYTIDFSDAVKDLNEGNVLDGLAIDFSTGDELDTLRISGMVFEARNLEPAQGMLVGAYSNLSDTAITTIPFERITKTNQLGQFTLRNLKAGTYRIFALNDMNRDYHWDRSEDIAFYDVTLSPSSEPVIVTDTLVSMSGERDSTVTRPATRFLPDDVLLTWFNEGYASQYLKDYKREVRNIISIDFGTKADTLPILRLINTPRAGDEISSWSVLDASPTLDTLRYWITDTALVALDSLILEARYLRTDTLDNLSMTTDTLKFIMRTPKSKKKEEETKKKEEKEKKEEADSVPKPVPTTGFKVATGSTIDLNKPLTFTASTPLVRFDTTAVRMEMQVDTVWYPVKAPVVRQTLPMRPLDYSAPYVWEGGTKYRITIDSAAMTDIYGLLNNKIEHEFTTKQRADYSSLSFNISGLDGRKGIVEILDRSDKVMAAKAIDGSYVKVEYLAPATYYARLFIDADGDGKWSTGSLTDSIQPEEVYYYPKKIVLKKNWDIEQSWDINELPVDQQKPREIVKNKPKRKKNDRNEDQPTDEDEEDDFFDDPFMRNATRNNGLGSGNGRFDRTNNNNTMLRR